MEPTLGQIMAEIRALRGEALTPDLVRDAVGDAIRDAAADPALWSSIMLAIQSRAKEEAGGWLFGGLKAIFSRLAWVLVIGGGVYALGGWTALAALFKSGAHQ